MTRISRIDDINMTNDKEKFITIVEKPKGDQV